MMSLHVGPLFRTVVPVMCLVIFAGSANAQHRTDFVALWGDAPPDGNGTFAGFAGPVINNSAEVAFWARLNGTSGGFADSYGLYRGDGTTLIEIVRTGQSWPGGGASFSTLGAARITDSGEVAFHSGDFLSSGLFLGDGETVTMIVRDGITAPNGNGAFATFGTPVVNASGQVAYFSALSGTSGGFADREAIFSSDASGHATIARRANALPVGAGTFWDLEQYVINESGQVAFFSSTAGTTGADNEGIYRGDGTELVEIVRKGQFEPGGLSTFFFLGPPVINSSGRVAFQSRVDTNGSLDGQGVYTGDGNVVTEIARTGQLAAPGGTQPFFLLYDPRLNDAGELAFQGVVEMPNGGPGVFKSTEDGLTQIVRQGQTAPDGNGTFLTFDDPALNQSGQVAFFAVFENTAGGTIDNSGIMISDGVDFVQVAREGMPLLGSTLGATIEFDSVYGINDFGQVTYYGQLVDGRPSIQRWTPELHWRSASNGNWEDQGSWTLGIVPGLVHDVVLDSANDITVFANGAHSARNVILGSGTGTAALQMGSGSFLQIVGTLNLGQNGAIEMEFGSTLAVNALVGSGLISGSSGSTITIEQTLDPGNSAGPVGYPGHLVLGDQATTQIELGGVLPGEFDQVSGLNLLQLDGALDVSLINGFQLTPGMQFTVFDVLGSSSGNFNSLVEGSHVGTFDGIDLFITYQGNDGLDVSLFTLGPCGDTDADNCDDCSSGLADPSNDGPDADADGLCDFGDLDDDNDGMIDHADCAPFDETLKRAPTEISGIRVDSDKIRVTWDSVQTAFGSATVSDVLSGNLGLLPVGSEAGVCLANGSSASFFDDNVALSPGEAVWYLIRAENGCGLGSYGSSTDGPERATATCP